MFGWKKRINKIEWAETLYHKKVLHPERESDEKLTQLTPFMLKQHHRIIMESVQIVLETKYEDTRQGRISLIRNHYQEMMKLKPFCSKEQLVVIQEAEKEMRRASLL